MPARLEGAMPNRIAPFAVQHNSFSNKRLASEPQKPGTDEPSGPLAWERDLSEKLHKVDLMKFKVIAAVTLALLPSVALAQQAPNPTNKAFDDAQRPDKYQGTTPASPPVPSSDQPPPTTDPRNDSQRMGPGFQGQPHGTGGVPKTVPQD